MNCLPLSGLRIQLHFKSILSVAIVILTAFWSLPVAARSPNPGDNEDIARKHDTNSAGRSAPQNNQPERFSHRDITPQSSHVPTRSIELPQPSIIRSHTTNDGPRTVQSRRDPQPSLQQFSQPRSAIKLSESAIKLPVNQPRIISASSDVQSSSTKQITVPDVRRQLAAPKFTDKINQPGRTTSAVESATNRRGEVPKFVFAADTNKSTNKSSDNSDQRSGRQEIRQRFQDRGQSLKTMDADKTNQNIRRTDAGTSTTNKDANQLQNIRSGSASSMSEIRKRLGAEDRGKGFSSTGTTDKSETTSSKINFKLGGSTTITPGNPVDATSIDRVKQRLDAGERGVKRGPPDLILDKKTETSTLKHQDGNFGPGLTTKQLPHTSTQLGDMKVTRDEMLKSRFPDRLKSGELDKVTKGDIAQKVKLSDQFHMMQQGDVARRMELQKHVAGIVNVKDVHINDIHHLNNVTKLMNVNDYYAARPYFYHGVVGPAYVNNCFKFVYYGPTFFAGACWYPHWNPWVAWSWNYHCHPIWDPRPIWCRPVIYDPYYDWTYWQTPVWASLSVVDCGTWVDVQKPVIPEAQYDLQLLAVRFVDPGHPEENLGPRYRVWFRNNSDRPIENPFNVMLFAGNDNKLTAELPRGGVRVNSIEAGDTQSVDIRLPIETATMWRDAEGKPAPFQVLHAIVDANREIEDAALTNNGAAIPRDEVLQIDPAAFEADPARLVTGGEIILAGEGLGPQPGQVLVNVAGRELQAEVLGWYDLGVRVNVPQIELSEPTPAEVIVVRGDGAATNPIKITLTPGQAGPTLVPPPPVPQQ